MDDLELAKKLSSTGKYRNTIYLAPAKIERYYVQKVAQVTEFVQSRGLEGKASGNILGFLGAEVSADKGVARTVVMSPMLQAIAAENAALQSKSLIELSSTTPVQGELLRYIGAGRVTTMNVDVAPDMPGLSPASWARISERRRLQESILRMKEDKVRSILLTFIVRQQAFTSIASTDFVDMNALSSYCGGSRYGILGTMEGHPEREVTFVDPLWIWAEGE